MRRGARGRGYGGRPPVSQQSQNNIPRLLQPPQLPQPLGGPLMTDHLQGLKDIDMELELLKRKREIIEQQQQILSNSYRQRNNYEQPMYSAPRESRYDAYTRLYEEPRGEYGARGGRGEGSRKRPHIPVWESEVPAKRPAPSPSRGRRPAPRASPPRFRREPEPRYPAPSSLKRPPPTKRKESNPTKASKPVEPARSRPAAEAGVLRADREPSHQMLGRLELALGAIVKEVRASRPQHEALFRQPLALRAMKQAVRDRLRTAMVGKPVSSTENIKLAYYEMYPPAAAADDVIMKGQMAAQNRPFVTVDAVNPESFFKKNVRNLMILKMDEMIGKLQEIYSGGGLNANKHQGRKNFQKQRPKQNKQTKTESKQTPDEGEANKKPETDETKDNIQEKDDAQVEEIEPNKEDAKNDVTESNDVVASCDKIDLTEDDEKDGKQKELSVETGTKANVEVKEPPMLVIPNELINNELYMALDKLLNYKMLHLIKRYTPEFVKQMDIDAMYQKTKAAITAETALRLAPAAGGAPLPPRNLHHKQDGEKPRPPIFYAKILGKPSLPKRKAMETFFSQYQPMSIKKHRTIHNLLFVGFVDKPSYDNMLAADGTTIGRFTLDIKVSERNDNKKKLNALKSEADQLNESTESMIGSDLDEQITDLLTSIRKSEDINFADDVVMVEEIPEQNAVKLENGDQIAKSEVDIGTEQNDNTGSEDDVVELKDVIQNDAVECNDAVQNDSAQNDVVQNDAAQNDAAQNDAAQNDAAQNDAAQNNAAQNDAKKDAVKANDVDNTNADDVGDVTENDDINQVKGDDKGVSEKNDTVGAMKVETKDAKTPTRSSARLATPGGIKTRRMSKIPE